MWLTSRAEIGKHRVRGDHFTHRNVVNTKRNGRSLRQITGDSRLVQYLTNSVHAHLLGDTHRGNVERFLESFADCDRTAELRIVVLWLPYLVAREAYLNRLIFDNRRGRDGARRNRCSIREWLRGRAQLSAHEPRAIEL